MFYEVFRDGVKVRGNLVLFRIQTKNREFKKLEQQQIYPVTISFLCMMSPDGDIDYECEIRRLRLHIAMLKDILNNLENDMYSRRTWRHVMLQEEKKMMFSQEEEEN